MRTHIVRLFFLLGLIFPALSSAVAQIPCFAYVANYTSNTVSIYTVDSTTGALRHNGYVAAGTGPKSVTVDPTGKFAYVAKKLGVRPYVLQES